MEYRNICMYMYVRAYVCVCECVSVWICRYMHIQRVRRYRQFNKTRERQSVVRSFDRLFERERERETTQPTTSCGRLTLGVKARSAKTG